jgi:hypothetical protein
MRFSTRQKDYLVSGLALGFSAGIFFGCIGGLWFHQWQSVRFAAEHHYSAAEIANQASYDYMGALYPFGGGIVGSGVGAIIGMLIAGVLVLRRDKRDRTSI